MPQTLPALESERTRLLEDLSRLVGQPDCHFDVAHPECHLPWRGRTVRPPWSGRFWHARGPWNLPTATYVTPIRGACK